MSGNSAEIAKSDFVKNPDPKAIELFDSVIPTVRDFHMNKDFAPSAAFVDAKGEIVDSELTTDGTAKITVQYALDYFTKEFKEAASKGEIQTSIIFYHGNVVKRKYRVAATHDECNAVIAYVESKDFSYVVIVNYRSIAGGILYDKPIYSNIPHNIFK